MNTPKKKKKKNERQKLASTFTISNIYRFGNGSVVMLTREWDFDFKWEYEQAQHTKTMK